MLGTALGGAEGGSAFMSPALVARDCDELDAELVGFESMTGVGYPRRDGGRYRGRGTAGELKAVKLGLTQRLFVTVRTERHESGAQGPLRMITERNGEKYGAKGERGGQDMRFEARSGAKTNPNHGSQSVGIFNSLNSSSFSVHSLILL